MLLLLLDLLGVDFPRAADGDEGGRRGGERGLRAEAASAVAAGHAHLGEHLGGFGRSGVGVQILLDALLLRIANVAVALVIGDDASWFGQSDLSLDGRD